MPTHPLVSHTRPDQIIAWRNGAPVPARDFLSDIARLAALLPAGGHVFNICQDRYRFAVGLCAALVSERISLLPSSHTPETIRRLREFAPDTFCLHDSDDCDVELPLFRYPEVASNQIGKRNDASFSIPEIDAARTMAYVFTSGSTGTPVPHRKTWGMLVECIRGSAERLGFHDGRAYTLIGTVPAQHMYGFESTVLLALLSGVAFSNGMPFYPGDICAELEAVPAPRVLVTSPIHLRALLASDQHLPPVAHLLSATAPLSAALARDAEARWQAPLLEIYGSTETGQIATRRTARENAWHLFSGIRIEARADIEDNDTSFWISGGHLDTAVPMGDKLELIDDQHFLLHGRKADLINIAGKRTSLAYLNHQLAAVPGVVDGAFFMPEAAPGEADDGMAPVARLAAMVVAPTLTLTELQRALRERIDAAFMPRPLMLVDALPRNAVSKLPRAALLAKWRQQTHAEAEAEADALDKASLSFTIPTDHPALPGHFPGHPIVPGVVLLDHALSLLGAALQRPLHLWRLQAAKFPSPAQPGESLDISYEETSSGAIRFTIRAGQRDVASGVLAVPQAGPRT